MYEERETEEKTGEDWRLRGRARTGHPHRQAVWLNALHREAVSFNGVYVGSPLTCPGCSQPMESQMFDGHYGRSVALDLCHGCGALWFDGLESLALAPGAILRLFTIIHDNRPGQRNPLPDSMACPRCRQRLALTQNMQRATRFTYWRCPAEHGHFITFVDFLREKNFVRPLSPQEVVELRKHIAVVNCANCGAPVDVDKGSGCAYCHAPLSLLDPEQVEKVVRELRQAEQKRQTVDPTATARVMLDKMQVESLFRRLDPASTTPELANPLDIVGAGLAVVARLLASDR